MSSAQEFRDYADKCLELPATANSEQERNILRRMALTWWRIARLTEEGRSSENLADIFPACPFEPSVTDQRTAVIR